MIAVGLSLCISWGCSAPSVISGVPVTGPVSLLQHFPQARKTVASEADVANYIKIADMTVEENPDRVLFLHPPSEVVFRLRLQRAAVLNTAIAVDPAGWGQGGDGVTFYVAVREQGGDLPSYLFSRHLRPQLVETHRGWQSVQLDLTPYLERDIELIFGTHPGPESDPSYDWAVWRDPLLYHPLLDSEWVATRASRQQGAPRH